MTTVYLVHELVDLGSHVVDVWSNEQSANIQRDALMEKCKKDYGEMNCRSDQYFVEPKDVREV